MFYERSRDGLNVIEEGFDLSVRISELPDSSLVARRLAPCRHSALSWQFRIPDGEPVCMPVSGNLQMNNSLARREAMADRIKDPPYWDEAL